MRVVKPKVIALSANQHCKHWIEMKVKMRSACEELERRKAHLRETLSKMNVDTKQNRKG